MQVRFNNDGCFIEKDGRVIAKGRRDGHLFILDSNEVKPAKNAEGLKTETNIELWHKRIGHVVVKKTIHKRNRCTKAWEPALHARTL